MRKCNFDRAIDVISLIVRCELSPKPLFVGGHDRGTAHQFFDSGALFLEFG